MFRNYLKLAARHLLRKKAFSFINLFGLTVGLISCILIGLFITDELGYDSFNVNADRIVRVTMDYGRGSSSSQVAQTGTKPGPQFKRVFPEVKEYVRTMLWSASIANGGEHFTEKRYFYADPSFFSVFTFPLLKGDPNCLNSKEAIVLTASAAQKYFGSTDIIGKTLQVNDTRTYRIGAVVKDPPGNSQIQFDFVVSFLNLGAASTEDWWTANYVTYLLLQDGSSIDPLQSKINDFTQRPDVRKEARVDGSDYQRFHLEPLKRVHLYSSLPGFEPNGSIVYVYVLTLIAMLILVIACFNYTNLAIAQSSSRTGEIGIRKVLGALKGQLFTQFTGESMLVTFIALVLAVTISTQLLPLFNDMTGKHLVYTDILRLPSMILILLTGLFIGLLAGAYPALVLSNTRLINILKSGFRITGGQAGLRRTLIVVQFVISLFLIITTVVILQQMSYIRNKNLGLERDHVMVVPIDYRLLNYYNGLKTALATVPGVNSISGSYNLPISASWGDGINANTDHGQVSFSITAIPCDLNYISTMQMQLLAGSDFTTADLPANNKDTTRPAYRYILNETAVKKLGWTPQEAIGKVVDRGEAGIIKGVVKDFHFASMHQPIGPLMLFADTSFVRNILIRISGQQMPSVIAHMQGIWKEYIPDRTFDYHFLDEDYNHLYTAEQRTAKVFTLFSSLAILLALLGLFGLAAISTIQRTKEIGIRKVLGASLFDISLLVSRNFVLLVGVSILIAAPLAGFASAKWLEGFAYRVQLQYWIFLAAAAGVIGIAFATVSYHAIRAGKMNPVESLKTE